MADAVRRAGRDDVAGPERCELGAERDDCRHRVNQHVGAGMLHLFAVEPRRQREARRIGDLVGGDDPRPERPGGREVLARRDRDLLVVAHAAVDEAGVPDHVLERVLRFDVTSRAPDHDRQLALEVEALRDRRPDHLTLVADKRVDEAREHARLLRDVAPGLGRVRAIVDAGAQDLVGVGDRRQEADVGELVVRLRALGDATDVVERVRGERIAQGAVDQALVQRDDAVADDDAIRRLFIDDVACEFHVTPCAYARASRRAA
jgi:hypothetical protein